MPYSSSELDFLLSHPEAVEAAQQYPLTKKSELADLTALRKQYGENARALVELVRARALARKKIHGGDAWMLDGPSAQQATPGVVADVRAAHLREFGVQRVTDVTCSVGTELAAMQRAGIDALGSDLDQIRLRMARENVPEVPVVRADALQPVTREGVVIADPARRGTSGRIHRIDQLMPPLPELVEAYRGRELAVKCAPGIDFADVAEWAGQIDIVSVDGDVKEACVYTPGLAKVGRRAVLLRGDRTLVVTDAQPDDIPEKPLGDFVFDVDGAIVRAGLVRHVAHQHGLWQLDPRIAYLTGDSVPDGETGLRAFAVHQQVPLKQLKSALQGVNAGAVEILVRGVDVDPDQLRKKLKLRGSESWSVMITRVGISATAIVCQPVMREKL